MSECEESEQNKQPSCWEILGDMFQCGGMIEECVLFEAFEDQSFAIPPLEEHGCESEIYEASGCT
jgi:hypothetical protein